MSVSHRTRSLDDEGHRRSVHPIEVSGRWKKRRERLHFVLIAFFLALPWIQIGGKPLLLLNIFERKFSVFGVMFRAHDVPFIFFFFATFALFFGLLTALFGRVWCGWACPQTVFIEAVFRRIERWVEGDAFKRRKQDAAPATLSSVLRTALKWLGYLAATLVITHSVLAVFVGPEELRAMIEQGPGESPQAFLFIVISTLIILLDFGWFREQFCIVVCPYGRIQSVFQDEKTKTVTYDAKRGEPRGKWTRTAAQQMGAAPTSKDTKLGDCVDCSRCVQVCPTGIDIREGSSQLECIACTACIDACDDVMTRMKRAPGLIRYDSIDPGAKIVRGRSIAYFSLLLIAVASLVFFVQSRTIAMVEIFKNRGDPFTVLNAGASDVERNIANLFITEVSNRNEKDIWIRFSVSGAFSNQAELIMPNNPVRVAPGEYLRQPLTIRFSKKDLHLGKEKAALRVQVYSSEPGSNPLEKDLLEEQMKELVLVGPYTSF